MVNHSLKYAWIATHLQPHMDEAEPNSALRAHYVQDIQHHWLTSCIDMIQNGEHLETILGLREKRVCWRSSYFALSDTRLQ
jgi:hypothetical protein